MPPDYFSADGQAWGNPVYDWDVLRRTGYGWCIDRLRALLSHVDVVRLDHFRGFAAAWHVPVGESSARHGQWVPGPGSEFFLAAKRELGNLPFIAEDLGLITPDVIALPTLKICRARAFFSLDLTAIRRIRTCRTITFSFRIAVEGQARPHRARGASQCVSPFGRENH